MVRIFYFHITSRALHMKCMGQVFADDESSRQPIDVPGELIWNLTRRILYCGTSITSICRGKKKLLYFACWDCECVALIYLAIFQACRWQKLLMSSTEVRFNYFCWFITWYGKMYYYVTIVILYFFVCFVCLSGFICIRGFDKKSGAAKLLAQRFHLCKSRTSAKWCRIRLKDKCEILFLENHIF